MVVNLQVPLNVGNLLTSWGTVSYSRTLLHGVMLKNTTLLICQYVKWKLMHTLCLEENAIHQNTADFPGHMWLTNCNPATPTLRYCDLRQVHIRACMPNEKQDVMRKAFGAYSSSNLLSYFAGHQDNKQITAPLLSVSQLAHTLTTSHSPDITSNFYTTNIFVI